MKFNTWVQWRGDRLDYDLVIVGETPDGKRYPVTITVATEPVPRHGMPLEQRSLETRYPDADGGTRWVAVSDFLQSLVDECYRAGIIPSAEVSDSHAMKAHLRDMRALAFGALKIDQPMK